MVEERLISMIYLHNCVLILFFCFKSVLLSVSLPTSSCLSFSLSSFLQEREIIMSNAYISSHIRKLRTFIFYASRKFCSTRFTYLFNLFQTLIPLYEPFDSNRFGSSKQHWFNINETVHSEILKM